MNQKTYSKIEQLLLNSDLVFHNKSTNKPTLDLNFKNETILITGAAGSIGSELTRHLVGTEFKSLVLIDNAESPLYDLAKELELVKQDNIEFILIDIRDQDAMDWLFNLHKPTIVFHTAAYKHVPLMEENAYEAVRLNILATKIIADLSIRNNIKKFVFISTDKAVKPISVMGMTKRIAEAYLNYLNINYKTDFKSTRFGNVLGSNGSVLPIFLKQINSGRPITITSYDATRYFINKSKACQLILTIANLNKDDGYLFTFNMGNSVKIIDLATVLIKLITKDGKHEINLVGLRRGEKMHEDILSEEEEELELTKFDDILKVKPRHNYSREKISFNLISNVTSEMENSEIKNILKDCINKLQSSPTLLLAI